MAAAKASAKSSSAQTNRMWKIAGLVLAVLVVIAIICCWCIKASAMQICKTTNLSLTAGQQEGAAGTVYQHMIFTNTGHYKCHMSGFPTAFLYGSGGYAIGNSAAARVQPAPVDITLAPHESANTVLGYPQAGNFDPGVCSAEKSVSVKIYPPSSITALDAAVAVQWCPGFSESSMQPGN